MYRSLPLTLTLMKPASVSPESASVSSQTPVTVPVKVTTLSYVCEFVCASGEIFVLDERFDYVVLSDLVPFAEDLLAVFQNAVRMMRPRVVIPMHYGYATGGDPEKFASLVGSDAAVAVL